ncbi:hypothetical protein E5225_15085 [Cellulomonas shaoxiangyii]|uniref:Glycine zipper domain-containing protein n=1 Tax=Cellulomonas shaoxiangyii TaxID=2566013 RepID=A0A4V1CMZ7_9CELL|nr:hypothetical protein E5225_15085 [Cellulomonas shaoxiangyii]TGY85079.1 hypothetical protein E5226_08440 [Cellulomonas shaoxiangyii]
MSAGTGSTAGAGSSDGVGVGSVVGSAVGSVVGSAVGSTVGSVVGSAVGSVVGSTVGSTVGSVVGSVVGSAVAVAVGVGDGVVAACAVAMPPVSRAESATTAAARRKGVGDTWCSFVARLRVRSERIAGCCARDARGGGAPRGRAGQVTRPAHAGRTRTMRAPRTGEVLRTHHGPPAPA